MVKTTSFPTLKIMQYKNNLFNSIFKFAEFKNDNADLARKNKLSKVVHV